MAGLNSGMPDTAGTAGQLICSSLSSGLWMALLLAGPLQCFSSTLVSHITNQRAVLVECNSLQAIISSSRSLASSIAGAVAR